MIPYFLASHAVPKSMMTSVPMMTVSAICAFLTLGSRKAITPFETASTPVIAAQPLEKDFSASQTLRPIMVAGSGCGISARAIGWPRAARTRKEPTATVVSTVPTKRKVGAMKAAPVSLTPRMFTRARNASTIRHSSQHVRLQPRLVGDDGSDPGGDADRGGQDVVDHQRRGGHQAGAGTQVFAGDGVGAAAGGIGRDRLAVAEKDDAQQDQNDRDDGDQMGDACNPKRDQQGQRSFRSVCGGGQGIKAENGNSGSYADVFGALFTCGQGSAK